MNGQVQKIEEGEKQEATEQTENQPTSTEATETAENPAVENTETEETKTTETKEETDTQTPPAKEMSAEQFSQYNETLRLVSKTAKAGITGRYNAFEDADVKARVKQQIIAGEAPNVAELAAEVVARLAPPPEPKQKEKPKDNADSAAEVLALKAENALLKAGITPERVDAATKLFIAEGGDLGKISEFVAKYPEWHKDEGGVVFTKAAPIGGKTTPQPNNQPILNDFEKKVAAARKKAGLD